MASNLRLIRQDDFTGGLNLRADQFQLAENESPRMLNVEIDPRGGVFSRGAMRRINTTAVSGFWNPEKLFPFYGNKHYLMLTTGYDPTTTPATQGDVYYWNGPGFTSLSIPVTCEHGASFAPWGDKLYIAGGCGSSSYRWDSTTNPPTLTALTASGPTWQNNYLAPSGNFFPKASHVVTHAGKVFAARVNEDGTLHPNRVRWSHPNNPEQWAENDYIDINDGGPRITGLAVVGGHLVVFKEFGVFAVFGYDSDTFQVVEISRSVGASSPHAISETENGVFFFSYPEGLMYYDGNSLRDVFSQLRPMFDLNFVNTNQIDEIYVNYINRRIWLSVPYSEVTSPDYPAVSFVFDPSIGQDGAWTMFTTADEYGISGGCSFVTDTGEDYYVAAHPVNPFVLRVDMYTQSQDNITGLNTNFVSRYRTRWLDGGNYSQKKMFRRPDIVAKQMPVDSQVQLKVYRDYEEADGSEIRDYTVVLPQAASGMTWGSSSWGVAAWGSLNTGSYVVNGRNAGLARSLQIEFSGPQGISWGVNSFTLKYSPRRVKS
jgi:hypothetical protein